MYQDIVSFLLEGAETAFTFETSSHLRRVAQAIALKREGQGRTENRGPEHSERSPEDVGKHEGINEGRAIARGQTEGQGFQNDVHVYDGWGCFS